MRTGCRSQYFIVIEPNLINQSNSVHEPNFNHNVLTCDEPDTFSLN